MAIEIVEMLIALCDQTSVEEVEESTGYGGPKTERKARQLNAAILWDRKREASCERAQKQEQSPSWFMRSPQPTILSYAGLRVRVGELARSLRIKGYPNNTHV